MAKMNYDRPYLKYIDNLKRVQREVESWYSAPKKKPATIKTKDCYQKIQIEFCKQELDVCLQLLSATENYYAKLSSMLEAFPKSKIKIKQHEENLRTCIRNFIQIYMNKMIKKDENSGIFKFYKLLEKSLPKDDLLFEMIDQEINQINQNLEIINQ